MSMQGVHCVRFFCVLKDVLKKRHLIFRETVYFFLSSTKYRFDCIFSAFHETKQSVETLLGMEYHEIND